MSAARVRVLIADDHTLFRDGIRTLLMSSAAAEFAGEAKTGAQAIALAERLQPDVILMDLKMPEMNGIEATRRIVQVSPHIGILILTMFDDDQSVFTAMRAGARGYVMKGAGHEEMIRAILATAHGEAIFSAGIAVRMMAYFAEIAKRTPIFPQLTGREHEILEMITLGLENGEIGRLLDLSLKTVQNHVSNILNKLQVADRTQAILKGREAGLGNSSQRDNT